MSELNNISRWIKNSRVVRDAQGNKTLEFTLIDQNYSEVVKEDVLNTCPYERVSQIQKMIYHAFKEIEIIKEELQLIKDILKDLNLLKEVMSP